MELRMFKRKYLLLWVVGALFLLLLSLNFLNFYVARSATEVNHSLSTYRTGEALPESMMPGFSLPYAVSGEDQLAAALETALQAELETQTSVGTATPDSLENETAPFLLVDLASNRLWTPFYGRATLQAQIYYASDGDVPWPLEEPVELQVVPAIKSDGQFTVVDTTWGLLSKPAYNKHLAEALAEAVAAALQNDVFKVLN